MERDLPKKIPAVSRVHLNPDQVLDSLYAESVVERLYNLSQWYVLARRFKMRGSEIDLAFIHPKSMQARIVEVKLRKGLTRISLNSTSNLLPYRKITALSRGAQALQERTLAAGLKLDWSFDLALVVPESENRCLVYTWLNVMELSH